MKIKFLFLIFVLSILFTSCVSIEESEKIGENSIIGSTITMEYYYTLKGFTNIKADNDNIEKLINLPKEKLLEFSESSFFKTSRRDIDKDHIYNNLGFVIGFRNTFYEDKDMSHLDPYLMTFIPYTLSGAGNLYYNLSYIINLPSKILHTIYFESKYADTNIIWSIIKNLLYGIWGLLQAILMLIIGTILGTLTHPINTIVDLFTLFMPFIEGLWMGIKYIFIGYV